MRPFRFVWSNLVCAAFVLSPFWADARDRWVNPGTFGANALPALPIEEPWTLKETQLWAGAAAQWGRQSDVSVTPTYRLLAPVGEWVTVYFEGMAIERWWASEQTRNDWGLQRGTGFAKADIRVGAKVLVFDSSAIGGPAFAVRVLTKTTAGKGYEERRFIDAPAYLAEGLVGQHWMLPRGILLTLTASAGFLSWQQGAHGQNDAVTANLAISARFFERVTVQLEGRGYAGWQENDKVALFSQRVIADATSWLSFAVTANEGFLDAPRFEGRLDMIVRLPALVPLIVAKAQSAAPEDKEASSD